MLESLLAGQALTLHVNPLLVWGPAALLALVAVLLILWPQSSNGRRAVNNSIIVRDQPGRRPGRIIVGVILAGLAMAWATVLREPQVTLTAESLTCRSWPRPIAWRDVSLVRSERIGFTNRPVVRLIPTAEPAAERRGPLSQITDRLVGVVRGPSRIGSNGAICGLDNLTLSAREAGQITTVAWGRARFGPLPNLADPQDVTAWCGRNPRAACTLETLRQEAGACRGPGASPLSEAACRYERFAAPQPTTTPARRPAPPPATPQPRTQNPAPSPAPSPPPATAQPPAPASPPPAPPAAPPQASPQPPQAAPAPAKPPAPEGPPGKPAR